MEKKEKEKEKKKKRKKEVREAHACPQWGRGMSEKSRLA